MIASATGVFRTRLPAVERRERWAAGEAKRGRFAIVLAALSIFAFFAFTAVASASRSYEGQLAEAPSGAPVPGPFVNPHALAIDGEDNVWVSDNAESRGVISTFDSSGNYLSQQDGGGQFVNYFGSYYLNTIALHNATGYLYVADSAHDEVHIFDNTGAFVENFQHFNSGYVWDAVDNSGSSTDGTVYTTGEGGPLEKRDSSGAPANFSGAASYITGSKITGVPEDNGQPEHSFGYVANLGTDAEGNIYVADTGQRSVEEYAPSGIFIQELTGTSEGPFSSVDAVAVDPVTGAILVADSGQGVIHEFDSEGNFLLDINGSETPAGSFSALTALAVSSTGHLYVVDAGHGVVDYFHPDVILPKLAYAPVSNVTRTSATVGAQGDPNGGGDITTCHVEYGPSPGYGSSAMCNPDPNANPPASHFPASTDVSSELTDLTPETTYHYRFVMGNENGAKLGGDHTFTTPPAVQQLQTEPASGQTATTATLNGSFVGDTTDTHFYFEWGTDTSYGHLTAAPPGEDAGSTEGLTHVSADVSGLELYTPLSPVYHARIVATNGLGTTVGPDRVFHSAPPLAPAISGTVASNITRLSATLNAAITPNFGDTVYLFEYGVNGEYGTNTAISPSIGSDGVAHFVSVQAPDLNPGSTYHFRAVATNFGGTTYGPDEIFNTPDSPRIDQTAVSAVTGSGARLEARITPNFRDTAVHFEYGPNTSYGAQTSESLSAGAGNRSYSASASVFALRPGTTYHFRAVASNSSGTTTGPDQTFTTTPAQTEPARTKHCKRGAVMRHGQCVKRQKHKSHHNHRHHKSGERRHG